MWNDKIYVIYPAANSRGHIAAMKYHFYYFKAILGLNLQDPAPRLL